MLQDQRVQAAAGVLKVAPHELVARVETLVEERRKMERELTEARKALAMGGGEASGGSDVTDVNGVKFIGRVLKGVSPQDLKALADEGKKSLGSGVVALVAVSDDGKGAIVVAVTNDLTTRFNAVALVKVGSIAMGGKGGGGRPDMAQAGGPDGSAAETSLAAVKAALS